MNTGKDSRCTQRGILIAIEGLDRAGKSTQARLLADKLEKMGKSVKLIRFPDRSTRVGHLIDEWLRKNEGDEIPNQVLHLLFSANRWEKAEQIRQFLQSGTSIIVDRYHYSGAAYASAIQRSKRNQDDSIYDKNSMSLGLTWSWASSCGLPQPDLCIFLDIDPNNASKRLGYGNELFERENLQQLVREEYFRIFTMCSEEIIHPSKLEEQTFPEITEHSREAIVVIQAEQELSYIQNLIWQYVTLTMTAVSKSSADLKYNKTRSVKPLKHWEIE